jgi:hypothetical protein
MRAAAADKVDSNDVSALRTTTMMRAMTMRVAAATVVWWTLPSPLLCPVLHACLLIVSKYIQYWIKMAAIGHAKLYGRPPAMDHPNNGGGMGISNRKYNRDKDKNDGELF